MSYYVDLAEFPLYNWDKCQDGQLNFMRLNSEIGTDEQDEKAWELLQYNYIERFGVSARHARYTILQRDLLVLRLEKSITDNRFLDNQIEDIQDELKSMFKNDEMQKNTLDISLIHMNKVFNCGLDKRKIMTLQYFLMAQEYGKKN